MLELCTGYRNRYGNYKIIHLKAKAARLYEHKIIHGKNSKELYSMFNILM